MVYPTENTTFNSSSEAERKTQRFYLSCLQVERIEELGAQPLRDLIDKVGALGEVRRGPGRGQALGAPMPQLLLWSLPRLVVGTSRGPGTRATSWKC